MFEVSEKLSIMKRMRSQKVKFLLVGSGIFAVAWIGYWVGYTHSQSDNLSDPNFALNLNKKDYKISKYMHMKAELPKLDFKHSNQEDKVLHKDNLIENIREKLAHSKSDKQNELQNGINKLNQDEQVVNVGLPVGNNLKRKNLDEKRKLNTKDDAYYALIHSGTATKVHNKIHENIKNYPDNVSPDLYILKANELPKNKRFRPSIGNGHIGTVVHSDKVFMNGLYNGYMTDSHRAVIPSTAALNITNTLPASTYTRNSALDLAQGMYIEEMISSNYEVSHRVYAHRNLTRLLIVEVDLIRKKLNPISLKVSFNKWTASDDITFKKRDSGIDEVSYKYGNINAAETDQLNMTEVHVYYDHIPDVLDPPSGSLRTKWVFLTAIAHTQQEALLAYTQGRKQIKNHDGLYRTHIEAWGDLWSRGNIHIHGNDELAKNVYSSLYYLMSSLPVKPDTTWPFVGLSPTGLPYGDLDVDYQGHVMWDQETWMYPPVLFFHSDIAKTLLETRKRTSTSAKKIAQSRRHGEHSMEYPWESAFTGIDVTRDQLCGKYEVHISGDISRAVMQYLYATEDHKTIHNEGFAEIIAGIANFWVSRLRFNEEIKLYEITGVMPPDEHANIVDNSVYTNSIAQMSLAAMEQIFTSINKTMTYWKKYAENIYIPFDKTLQYHPEYTGYIKGKAVKQADAILLGYPLNRKMPAQVRRNDLTFYQQATEKTGPAMTWCMFSIGWLELEEFEKAAGLFETYKEYIQGDFKVWTEQPKGTGAVNFLTGIGGFLQNIINGYGGFRLHANNLEFNPVLPPGVDTIEYIGIDYLGSSIDFVFNHDKITVILQNTVKDGPLIYLYFYEPESVHSLQKRVPVTVKRARGALLSRL